MNKYKIVYRRNGYEDEVYVYAANRVMAFEIFESFGFQDVDHADCICVDDE